jgi:hypothetical protein
MTSILEETGRADMPAFRSRVAAAFERRRATL